MEKKCKLKLVNIMEGGELRTANWTKCEFKFREQRHTVKKFSIF